MNFKTFEYKRISGGILTEHFDGERWWLEYAEGGDVWVLPMYSVNNDAEAIKPPYLGYTLEEVQASGTDILGKALMKDGEVDYSDVIGALPRITENAYSFIGGPASHSNMTVDTRGAVYRQLSGRDIGGEAEPDYMPWCDHPELEGIMPKQIMLGEEIPVLINVYTVGGRTIEIIYFIEPGDSGRDPILWIRKKFYTGKELCDLTYEYKEVELIYELPEAVKGSATFSADQLIVEFTKHAPDHIIIEAFADTVAYWVKFAKRGTSLSLPEKRLERVARGAMAAAAVTCTANRPHYGHKYYGKEIHDNFPPNYIWLIETACVLGRENWARSVFEYLVDYATTDEGRIVYRQGRALNSGASATEYSCLLFLAERYFDKLGIRSYNEQRISRLCGMGNIILAHCVPCPEFGGRVLVKMCAEADTNSRVHVYLNNNLWSVRGLRALASIISRLGLNDGEKYSEMADIIWQNTSELLRELSVKDERFGTLPPFRFDYTATPHTLSNCKDTFAPMGEEEYAEYMKASISRGDQKSVGQDVTENCYANYRYYPESLSAMLLPEELANGAEALRESLGGEVLGMTRFRTWIDNWPVLHHARFLIETGRIDKYLLLLYSHTELHGNRERLCYYEQVKLFGRVSAHDCLPSLLTSPCMIGWMLAYEPMRGGLRLLSALPKAWYKEGFEAIGVGYSGGKVDILSDGVSITVRFSGLSPEGCELHIRDRESLTLDDIRCGAEAIESISGNVIKLKSGLSEVTVSFK
ncbi:MAG: hypothetical protein IJE25_01790 [Clostridia bacterium]|nr:hypothetical protein [Clostridia bacterium]